MVKALAYRTRVLFAIPERDLSEMQRHLRKLEGFQVISPDVTTGKGLQGKLERTKPDILVLAMTLPDLDVHQLLTTLSAKKLRPYVIAIAPHYDPYLVGIQRYPAVHAALAEPLALSPLLGYVLAGVAEGCQYFASSPPAPTDYGFSTDDLVLLALMVIGVETFATMRDLGWSNYKVYNGQRRLRKKLNVDTSSQIITHAIRYGLVGVLTEPGGRPLLKESA